MYRSTKNSLSRLRKALGISLPSRWLSGRACWRGSCQYLRSMGPRPSIPPFLSWRWVNLYIVILRHEYEVCQVLLWFIYFFRVVFSLIYNKNIKKIRLLAICSNRFCTTWPVISSNHEQSVILNMEH